MHGDGSACNSSSCQEQNQRNKDGANISSRPSTSRGVKTALEIGKGRLTQNAGIVARKATRRANAGKSAPIRINPDVARPDKGTRKVLTTLKDRKDPRLERLKKGS